MRTIDEIREQTGVCITGRIDYEHDVYRGWVQWPGFKGTVIFGYHEGVNGDMEHVSVSSYKEKQLPTWNDMAKLKKIFFREDEMAVEVHPAEDRYFHGVRRVGGKPLENVLHLWRPADGDFSLLNRPELWD